MGIYSPSGSPMLNLLHKLRSLKADIRSWRSSLPKSDVASAKENMTKWELRAETEVFGEAESAAFIQARADFVEAEKLHSLSLRQKFRLN